jgi:hypothetical protein
MSQHVFDKLTSAGRNAVGVFVSQHLLEATTSAGNNVQTSEILLLALALLALSDQVEKWVISMHLPSNNDKGAPRYFELLLRVAQLFSQTMVYVVVQTCVDAVQAATGVFRNPWVGVFVSIVLFSLVEAALLTNKPTKDVCPHFGGAHHPT